LQAEEARRRRRPCADIVSQVASGDPERRVRCHGSNRYSVPHELAGGVACRCCFSSLRSTGIHRHAEVMAAEGKSPGVKVRAKGRHFLITVGPGVKLRISGFGGFPHGMFRYPQDGSGEDLNASFSYSRVGCVWHRVSFNNRARKGMDATTLDILL